MIRIAVHGLRHVGVYRVDCECSMTWTGEVAHHDNAEHCPALPIAEVVVHMRMSHPGERPDINFSEQFKEWLTGYWERDSVHRATEIHNARREVLR